MGRHFRVGKAILSWEAATGRTMSADARQRYKRAYQNTIRAMRIVKKQLRNNRQ